MKLTLVLFSFVLLFGMNSCGVITKTRYGNGFKLNIESNLFTKGDDKKTMTSKKTIHSELQTPVPQLQNTDFETDICIADSVYPVFFKNSSEKNSLEKAVKENRNLNVHQSAYYSNYKAEMSECDSPDLSTKQTSNESKPIEPFTKLAVTFFFISIIGLILTILLGGTFIIFLAPVFTGIITSLILSIIGIVRIIYHKNKLRGLGRAISALLLSSFIILSALYVWIMSSIVY